MAKRKSSEKPKRGGKSKAGRKTCFGDTTRQIIKKLATRGFNNEEIAQCLKITPETLYGWQKRHPDFFKALKDWKLQADEKVEKSLYERACGYKHPDTKAQWVESDVQNDDGTWHKVGRWEYAELVKQYPPETPAATLWLKNRKPDVWRDKQEFDITDNRTVQAILAALPPGVAESVKETIKARIKK